MKLRLQAILRRKSLYDLALVIVLAGISLSYWRGFPSVPFHPDETSWIVMSADLELLFAHPDALIWQPGEAGLLETYRLLNAPLAKDLIGLARLVAGQPALRTDWDWSLNWDANVEAGALPSAGLLTAARMGSAFLFPFTLLLIYYSGSQLGGRLLGWIAVLLLAGNALVLLHTRRAMAEGALVFTACLFLACLVSCKKRAWLIAIPAALAFCAKQSALPMAGVGALAVFLYAQKPFSILRVSKSLLIYGVLYVAIVAAVNPFLWAHPVQAMQAAITARQELLTTQTREFGLADPNVVLGNPGLAGLSILVNLFITPPAIADVGNYVAQTQASSQAYLADPFNQILRGFWGGGMLLALTLAGFLFTAKLILSRSDPQWKAWLLVGLAGILQFLALVLTITLPFQRYVIPLVPFTSLWAGMGLAQLAIQLMKTIRKPLPTDLLEPHL